MGVWIPILALTIPVLAILFGGLQKIYKLRIEEAKVRAGTLGSGADAALDELRAEVEQLRRELGEVHERLDFSERLLARSSERDRLPGKASPPG
jgi:hypothetical protein